MENKKRGCEFPSLEMKRRDAKNGIVLKAGTSCRAFEKGSAKLEGGCEDVKTLRVPKLCNPYKNICEGCKNF